MLQSRLVTLAQKEDRLKALITSYPRAIVAFSGGVDSSYLAYVASQVLGRDAYCVTALSPAVSRLQRNLARSFASQHNLRHLEVETHELKDANYSSNPDNRCYFCKTELYTLLTRLGKEWNVPVIMDGCNRDDLNDYRPGRQAAFEWSVRSPLMESDLTKEDIRRLSRLYGLSSWNLPAMPCLASRFPYGTSIDAEKLSQVEQAEAFLWDLGLRSFRVRHHDQLARLEIDLEEFPLIQNRETLQAIDQQLRGLGYRWVTLDLRGFRSGSLNDLVKLNSSKEAGAATCQEEQPHEE